MKKYRLLLLVFILVGSACQETPFATPLADTTAVPTTMQPTEMATETSVPNGSDEVIAFYSDRDGNPEIYTIHPDGSGLARLTNDPAFDDSPAVSPDGKQIAFLTARHDPNPRFPNLKYELYVMDIDGKNILRLTDTEAAECLLFW